MAQILACGVATIDLVQIVGAYPDEDDEIRADAQYLWRGGNATNTLAVLSQLGHACSWLGTLADDDLAKVVRADLDRHNIDSRLCPQHPHTRTPTSHITLSQSSGSRTIVHYRELPELAEADCADIDLSAYHWLHVEGRNVDVTRTFLQQVRDRCPDIRISVELEKPRHAVESLLVFADHVMFSRHYAQARGYDSATALLDAFAADQQGRVHICTWGGQGAWCRPAEGKVLHAPARQIDQVIDSRAAGDVFNAAWIDAMLAGKSPYSGLQQACDLAGQKCTRQGIDGLLA